MGSASNFARPCRARQIRSTQRHVLARAKFLRDGAKQDCSAYIARGVGHLVAAQPFFRRRSRCRSVPNTISYCRGLIGFLSFLVPVDANRYQTSNHSYSMGFEIKSRRKFSVLQISHTKNTMKIP